MESNNIPTLKNNDEIKLVDIIIILLRRKKIIIFTVLIVGFLALLYTGIAKILPPDISYAPDVYDATGYLLLNSNNNSNSLSGMEDLASLAGLNLTSSNGNYGALAVLLATSNPLLDKVAERFNFLDDKSSSPKANARAYLTEKIIAELDGTTNIISITFTDRDPQKAKDVCNYLIDLLEKRFANIGVNRNLTEKNLLESKIQDVTGQMNVLETEIKDFQTKYGALTIDQLATQQIDILAQTKSQLISKELEISNYKQFSNTNDPALKKLENEQRSLELLINRLENGSSGSVGQKQLPELSAQFMKLQRDLEVQTAIYTMLVQQYETKKLQVEGDVPIFQILELAEKPERKSGPSRGLFVIGLGMIGFIVSLIIIFIVEYVDKNRDFFKKINKKLL